MAMHRQPELGVMAKIEIRGATNTKHAYSRIPNQDHNRLLGVSDANVAETHKKSNVEGRRK